MQNSASNPIQREEVNNHVHSTYSFSPYSPAAITEHAVAAGLKTVGLMDHDAIAGAPEFLAAARTNGIAATVGCEIRVNLSGTPLEGRRVNNPDEPNIIYIAFHAIPANQFDKLETFLEPIRTARQKRMRAETETLHQLLQQRNGPSLDFDQDILPRSQAAVGGTLTERHILFALAEKLIEQHGTGQPLVDYLHDTLQLSLSAKAVEQLSDPGNPHLTYDLLGVLKSELVPHFFIPSSTEECPSAQQAVDFATSIHAIPAYAYLGDIQESPTGDKRAQTFEDSFLDELIQTLTAIGFQAVTYMPPRNTPQQLARLSSLCQENGLMEISGVDINSSRQSFNCPILQEPAYHHLCDAAWALIAHENLALHDAKWALFNPHNPHATEPLKQRINRYASWARQTDPAQLENMKELL